MKSCQCGQHLLVVIVGVVISAVMLQPPEFLADAFSVTPPRPCKLKRSSASVSAPTASTVFGRTVLFAEADSNSSEENEDEGPSNSDVEQSAADAPPPVQSTPPPPPQAQQRRRLDPLVASLTRMDDETKAAKTIDTPLFEVPVDGSLVVLLPAAVIGVVGLLTSVYIGINSQDQIVGALNDLSDEINTAAVQRTNVVPDNGGCRGICASDSDNFVGKAFMESLSKNKKD